MVERLFFFDLIAKQQRHVVTPTVEHTVDIHRFAANVVKYQIAAADKTAVRNALIPCNQQR